MIPTREQLAEVVRRALVEDAGMPLDWFPTESSHVADAVVDAVMALLDAQPRLLTEDEATWYELPSPKPSGPAARWSSAMNAIVNDSGKWERWPECNEHGAWWNARVAQSAIENLYRYGFAVVAVSPEAIERIEADEAERTR